MTSDSGKITFRDNEAAQQYEIHLDGELAGHAEYRPLENARELPHTEVNDQYEGQGLGSRLVQFALDDLRRRGLNVVPTCPFVADYMGKHPEYQDLMQG